MRKAERSHEVVLRPTAEAIALVIDSARGAPAIAEFGAY
jgi:hypothetical protein